MAASTENSEIRTRGQQSPLASQRDKEAGNSQPRTKYFPMGYKEGFSQWWASIPPATAEHKVLSFIPYLQHPPTQTQTGKCGAPAKSGTSTPVPESPAEETADDLSHTISQTQESSPQDPYGPRKWHSSLIKLSGKDRALNEFSIEREGEPVENNLVMLHGYGAGLGFFYKNFEPLSRLPKWRLYALDLLGMGRSSRPTFRIHAKDRQDKITEAENWFCDSLEEWRKVRKIERFTLMGHSLGGYMAVCYALKYPGHLNKLILASPVGVPEDPYAVAAEMPAPNESTLANEVSQDQSSTTARPGDNNNFLNARSNAPADTKPNEPPRRRLPKWLTVLWDANISPFSLVRLTGPLGPRLVSGWTSRRFSQLPPAEAQALHDYAYSLFRQPGSGEYALAYILAPGAFARSPLIRRIGGVGRQLLPAPPGIDAEDVQRVRESGIPVVFMYGENDWMDVAGGFAAEEKLKEAKEEALRTGGEEARQRENGSSKVHIVRAAGHHVYLDGWQEFNEIMTDEMEDVARRSRA